MTGTMLDAALEFGLVPQPAIRVLRTRLRRPAIAVWIRVETAFTIGAVFFPESLAPDVARARDVAR